MFSAWYTLYDSWNVLLAGRRVGATWGISRHDVPGVCKIFTVLLLIEEKLHNEKTAQDGILFLTPPFQV